MQNNMRSTACALSAESRQGAVAVRHALTAAGCHGCKASAQTRYQARADSLQARLCTGASAARGAQSYVRNRKLVVFGALLTKSSTDWSLVHSERLNASAPRAQAHY